LLFGNATALDWTKTIFDVIDARSFSNIWFWIVLAVVWSSASHYVIGVPFDVIQRARRQGGQAMLDLEDAVRVNVNRILFVGETAGYWLLGLVTFVLTTLLVLAIWYRIEIAQAIILLALPMTLVGLLSLRLARRIAAEIPTGDLLFRYLHRHRFWTQAIGMVSIFVTATYGMYHNLVVVNGF
jgi:hypothetical protein